MSNYRHKSKQKYSFDQYPNIVLPPPSCITCRYSLKLSKQVPGIYPVALCNSKSILKNQVWITRLSEPVQNHLVAILICTCCYSSWLVTSEAIQEDFFQKHTKSLTGMMASCHIYMNFQKSAEFGCALNTTHSL